MFITLFSLAVASAAPDARCLDSERAQVVKRHAEVAAEHLGYPTAIAVNPPAATTGTVSIYVVKDRARGTCTPEDQANLCTASAGEIRCSAAAVEALLAEAVENDHPSTTLLFVLAHELAHLKLGHVGAFLGAPTTLSRADQLGQALAINEAELAKEQAADNLALAALDGALRGMPFVPADDTGVMAGLYLAELVLVTEARQESLKTTGHAELGYPDTLPAPAGVAPDWAKQIHCGSGPVPALGGTHPRWTDRLGRALQVVCTRKPSGALGVIETLTWQWCDIQQYSYEHAGAFDKALADALRARIAAGETCP